ncbi:MAG: hypothetical protein AB7Y46_16825 [Armatimonadota bacterium]
MRASGRAPWEMGLRLPRRRFWQAARLFATIIETAAVMRRTECPLLGG